jgi:hypothetical protein
MQPIICNEIECAKKGRYTQQQRDEFRKQRATWTKKKRNHTNSRNKDANKHAR